jgi:peptidoglycan/LPS O-acetylase OafA/YrhL
LKRNRIEGLDSIRAICAMWVIMGHLGGPPLTYGLDQSNLIAKSFGALYNNVWNGPAAVIVFFVISGFCIHYPCAKSLRIASIRAYAVRRFIRIVVPLSVAIGVSSMLSVNLSLFNDSILWSLVAELIYYGIYPFLLKLRRTTSSWMGLIIAGFLMSLLLASTNSTAGNYPSFGNSLNWILGLPCWLGGCWLAESVVQCKSPRIVSTREVLIWRLLIAGLAIICSILRFHTPVGYPWTLNIFGFIAVLWIARELGWFSNSKPNRFLEWVGGWSYSLYLFHVLAMAMYTSIDKPNFGFFFNWSLMITFVMVSSFLFYLIVERPAHNAARYLGNLFETADMKAVHLSTPE